jgi:hypothetical protein
MPTIGSFMAAMSYSRVKTALMTRTVPIKETCLRILNRLIHEGDRWRRRHPPSLGMSHRRRDTHDPAVISCLTLIRGRFLHSGADMRTEGMAWQGHGAVTTLILPPRATAEGLLLRSSTGQLTSILTTIPTSQLHQTRRLRLGSMRTMLSCRPSPAALFPP